MPCHCFQGDMKTCFYKIFMFLVGKCQEVAACKRALPSCHQSSSLHPSLLGWNPGLRHAWQAPCHGAIAQQFVFTVFLITVTPEWTWWWLQPLPFLSSVRVGDQSGAWPCAAGHGNQMSEHTHTHFSYRMNSSFREMRLWSREASLGPTFFLFGLAWRFLLPPMPSLNRRGRQRNQLENPLPSLLLSHASPYAVYLGRKWKLKLGPFVFPTLSN